MRIIIVDDEPFLRVNFKSFINWNNYGFELVGEACNGEEALGLIKSLKPDIVFLDIKMPVLDGIGVLKSLNPNDISPKIIVLSSFNEFEYVREAMKLGAFDYIHKPSLSADSIITAVMNAKDALEKERKDIREFNSLKRNMEMNISSLKTLFFKEMIYSSAVKEWEFDEKAKSLKIKVKNSNVYCMVISIDEYGTVEKRYENSKRHLLDFAIGNIVNELFEDDDELEFFQYDTNRYVVLKSHSKTRSMKDITLGNEKIIKIIIEALKQYLNINISVGVSSQHKNLFDLAGALNEALWALNNKFFDTGGKKVFYYTNSLLRKEPAYEKTPMPGEDINQLKVLLEAGRFDAAKAYLQKIFDDILDRNYMPTGHKLINEIFISIYFIVNDRLAGLNPCGEMQTMMPFPLEDITSADNIIQVRTRLADSIDYLNKKMTESKSSTAKSSKIKEVIEFIHKNYTGDISLETIAAKVSLNSSYLSRLFKEETGVTITNYILKCRIEAAIQYLKKDNLKSYEISELVGFQNVEYFCTTFKKITGKTPVEYKKTIQEESFLQRDPG